MLNVHKARQEPTRKYRILISQSRDDLQVLENILKKIDNDESLEESQRKSLRISCNDAIDASFASLKERANKHCKINKRAI